MRAANPDLRAVTVVRYPARRGPGDTAEMQKALAASLESGQCRIVADMSGCAFLYSCSFTCLLRALQRARECGGDLRLCGPGWGKGGRFGRLLDALGLEEVFETFETEAEAVRSFR